MKRYGKGLIAAAPREAEVGIPAAAGEVGGEGDAR